MVFRVVTPRQVFGDDAEDLRPSAGGGNDGLLA